MSDSMSVNQLLSQIRSIRQQTELAPPLVNDIAGNNIATPELQKAPKVDFSQLLSESIDAVNSTQQRSSALVNAYQRGDDNVSLTEVMVNMQKSEVSFKALVEVRNKFVDAYQEVMRMSI